MLNEQEQQKLFDSQHKQWQTTRYYKHLGMTIEQLACQHCIIKMGIIPELTNGIGIAHGGAIASLADASMGLAIRSCGKNAVTVDLNINFMSPGENGDTLYGYASILKYGNRIIVAESEIKNQARKLIAKTRATFYVTGDLTY